MPEAEQARANFLTLLDRPRRVAADRARTRWTRVLAGVVKADGVDVDLRGFHAHEDPRAPGACELRIDGVAAGHKPRMIADQFRQTIEKELQREASGALLKVAFQQLEDEANSSSLPPGQQRAAFSLLATVGVSAPGSDKPAKGE